MDSFAEPRRPSAPVSLAAVREQVRKLESDHRASGIPLSGRIIHVCHYLPVVSSLVGPSRAAIPSPPQTPPAQASDIPPSPTDSQSYADAPKIEQPTPVPAKPDEAQSRWALSVRYGHSAMISGIASLASTHEQLVVGWTGDIPTALPTMPPSAYGAPSTSTASESAHASPSKVPTKDIGEEERRELEQLLAKYRSRDEVSIEGGKQTTYVPVWLDNKEAHGHYEGYCKQSECLAVHQIHRFPACAVFCALPNFGFVLFALDVRGRPTLCEGVTAAICTREIAKSDDPAQFRG